MKNHTLNLFLDFYKRILTDTIPNESLRNRFFDDPRQITESEMSAALASPIEHRSLVGDFWPERAHTMIGIKRLDNLQFCVENILKNNIQGDLIETGVWRGGASIFMRLILKEHEIKDKTVYVADSFEGLPKPDNKYPKDVNDNLHTFDFLKVSLEKVQNNFKKYGVLDEQVKFLKGWFKDTMKNPPFEKLSVLRLDGDMYSSTWEVLENLYDKLTVGGYMIIDDYALPGCREAVNDFRKKNKILETIFPVDWTGVFWKKGTFMSITNNQQFAVQFSEAALGTLLKRYYERPDLQDAFPEVKEGNYNKLVNWARNVVSKIWADPDYDYLLLFKNWYVNYVQK